mmetsp:Transcript_32186/g.76371  ORF Transcript_32186/g.76371 Transcript_32186/m.76371 type:complete len:215 (+) Transcript_32186:67-711(+)
MCRRAQVGPEAYHRAEARQRGTRSACVLPRWRAGRPNLRLGPELQSSQRSAVRAIASNRDGVLYDVQQWSRLHLHQWPHANHGWSCWRRRQWRRGCHLATVVLRELTRHAGHGHDLGHHRLRHQNGACGLWLRRLRQAEGLVPLCFRDDPVVVHVQLVEEVVLVLAGDVGDQGLASAGLGILQVIARVKAARLPFGGLLLGQEPDLVQVEQQEA